MPDHYHVYSASRFKDSGKRQGITAYYRWEARKQLPGNDEAVTEVIEAWWTRAAADKAARTYRNRPRHGFVVMKCERPECAPEG